MGISDKDSPVEETRFIREYQQTAISREQNGSYTAKLPWKKDHPPLPTNHIVCGKRTRATIKRINQTPDLLRKYGAIIWDMKKGASSRKYPVQHRITTVTTYPTTQLRKIHLPLPSEPFTIAVARHLRIKQASTNVLANEQPLTPIENTRELQIERPVRMAARNALQRIANWTKVLKAAPEDVGN